MNLPQHRVGGWAQLEGGPFDNEIVPYPTPLPKTLVMMTKPFQYHDYERVGDTNIYQHKPPLAI